MSKILNNQKANSKQWNSENVRISNISIFLNKNSRSFQNYL